MDEILTREERTVLALRSLYAAMGYRPYKMGKFEEYDFYAENRRFLERGNIAAFTDTTGRLMALKPDVTLSIAKGAAARADTLKVYYDESVYRAPDPDAGFQEITQTGLECIGTVDAYAMGEVLYLAAESLRAVSPRFVLDVAHMGYVAALLPELGLEGEAAAAAVNEGMRAACAELAGVAEALEGFGCLGGVMLDISLMGDMEYYNGLVFKGYVEGAPRAVLSGGRYDALMRKLGREAGAVGFAVYLDALERLGAPGAAPPAEEELFYAAGASPAETAAAAKRIIARGGRVRVAREGGERA